MKFSYKFILSRLGLIVGATAIVMLLLPHNDKQSYSYELNQPWRYPLLTADFDMPIMRDSASVRVMRDSIDKSFIPFVKADTAVASTAVSRFAKAVSKTDPRHAVMLTSLLNNVYSEGIVDAHMHDRIQKITKGRLRRAVPENGSTSVVTIDATGMYSQPQAFRHIDSIYRASLGKSAVADTTVTAVSRLLAAALTPNIVTDTAADLKYRQQEYLTVNGALGVIKKGQRIVDRGEIVTPQIFTNLNTYMETAEMYHQEERNHSYFALGQIAYLFICFASLYVFLYLFRSRFFNSFKKMLFLTTFITAFSIFAILMFEYVGNGLYYVPFAAIPVVILVFFDSRTAIFSMLVSLLISMMVAVYPYQFLFLELAACLTACFSIHTLTRRSQLLRTALMAFVAYCISYAVFTILSEGNLESFEWRMIGIFAINTIALSFVYFLILIIEKIFGFTSMVTLVELSDINNPLLRRLAEEAPGTFQHSMQVSTLAAAAARAIGANTQLVRTGALYHDIGKLESPIFFTENQHGVNPHTGLNPETSAHKIISHVTAGLAIANKEKLPEEITDFIAEHHGKSVTRYFYNTAVNANPDKPVDRSKFTYPGPNPHTRETAILMMADSIEAASRSLSDYSQESINKLVDNIIDTQQKEGLFNESPISFRDVQLIKETFKKRLATIYHTRIAYPTLKGKDDKENEEKGKEKK
ncbi:MAG: HDIG domain-containing protein [Candidatus Amulumruptor caecigallinarius]|nr:HDIG domain-containing protein [Candidatus Amulumruptor caecigallinarius]